MALFRARSSFVGFGPIRAATAPAQIKIIEMDPLGLGSQPARELFRSLGDDPSISSSSDCGSTSLLWLGESSGLSSALERLGRPFVSGQERP